MTKESWGRLARRLESMCRKALYDFKLLEGAPRVAVALSGGKDSLTLLTLLHHISGKGFPEMDLHAIHVDGDLSCGAGISKSFLEGFCAKLGVPLITVWQEQKREGLECYSCSRERRRLLFEAAKEREIHTIAFGHHRDDSVQTLLLNLLHKGEFAGNLAKVPMKAYGVTIIRPLIYIGEAEIINFAKQQEFYRITCQCPVGQNSKRRQTEELIQELEEVFPHARTNLASAILKYGSNKALI